MFKIQKHSKITFFFKSNFVFPYAGAVLGGCIFGRGGAGKGHNRNGPRPHGDDGEVGEWKNERMKWLDGYQVDR